jgi:hypothetical protein
LEEALFLAALFRFPEEAEEDLPVFFSSVFADAFLYPRLSSGRKF